MGTLQNPLAGAVSNKIAEITTSGAWVAPVKMIQGSLKAEIIGAGGGSTSGNTGGSGTSRNVLVDAKAGDSLIAVIGAAPALNSASVGGDSSINGLIAKGGTDSIASANEMAAHATRSGTASGSYWGRGQAASRSAAVQGVIILQWQEII